jgi:hypothetical protein
MSKGTAALPCPRTAPWPTNSAVIRKIIWLLPPMASAVVPNQPNTLGWGGVTTFCGASASIWPTFRLG